MSAPAPGLWGRAGRRFLRKRAAAASLVVFASIVLACAFGSWLAPYLGTDAVGRELVARTLEGGRTTLRVGALAMLVSLAIGVAWGAVAGYFGGRVDALMLRAVDILRPLPLTFLALLLIVLHGQSFAPVVVAIGAISWFGTARAVRDRTRSLRRSGFVDAARLAGLPPPAIIRNHIVPNLLSAVIVCAVLTVPQAIAIESLLSFLGLGVPEPATSWGALLGSSAAGVKTAPWAVALPAGLLAATLLRLGILGRALREALELREP